MQAQPPSTDPPATRPRAVPASGYRAWLAWAAVGGLAAPSVEHSAAPAPTSVPPAPHTAAC